MVLSFENHAVRAEHSRLAAKTGKEAAEAALKLATETATGAKGVDLVALLEFFGLISSDPEAFMGFAAGTSDKVVDFLLTKVTGLDIPDGAIKEALLSGDQAGVRRNLGSVLMRFLDDNLDVAKVAAGFQARNTGEGERDSMARLIGSALRLQVGDMLMDWATQAIPLGLAAGLKDVAERFDKAMNLDDALEDIIQVPMQQVIERGMEQWYNRQIKPQDFTESEARQAFLQGRIDEGTLNKVLDNQGVRDDIRAHLLEMARPNLTESDVDQAYQHNLIEEPEIDAYYKDKGFQGKDAETKKKLVLGNRRWKLEEKIFELYGNLYRDDVATRAEVTPFLEAHGYEPDEVEMWFQVQELERRQRKWLSSKQLEELVGAGLLDPGFLIDYQVKQGMTGEDATLLYMQAMLARYQPDPQQDPECFKIIEDAFSLNKLLDALLSRLPVLDPTGTINTGDFKRLLECLLAKRTP